MALQHMAQCRMTIWLIDKGLLDRATVPVRLTRIDACLRRNFPNEYAEWGKGKCAADTIVQFCIGFDIPMDRKRTAHQRKIADESHPNFVAKPDPKPVVHPHALDVFLQSYEWRKLRMEAIKKYGRRCQCCGATPESGAVMNVDHIKPRRIYPELALSLDNLQVLCQECNHGKGNWDMTDWRKKEVT